MKVLIVKLSSMGDIIHTLPAIHDAVQAIPGIEFDWVVEENFQTIPKWLPAVKKVIPIAMRRWRKQGLWHSLPEIRAFIKTLRQEKYDLVLDAQGLFKTIWITRLARGPNKGLSFYSAREHSVSFFYQQRIQVAWEQHAVIRARQFFALALHYQLLPGEPHCLLDTPATDLPLIIPSKAVLFFHGTTWPTKHWPEKLWQQLAQLLQTSGYTVLLPWASVEEKTRAEQIHKSAPGSQLLPALTLTQLATLLPRVNACVAVDTGLGHLAAILGVPTVSLYGPTDPKLTGTLGYNQIHLQTDFACSPCLQEHCKLEPTSITPPCFTVITPQKVLAALQQLLAAPTQIGNIALSARAFPLLIKKDGLQLNPSLQGYWPQPNFPAIMQTSGTIFRQMPQRRTLRFEYNGLSFFIKQHFGCGWQEIFKNLLHGKLPIVSARAEYQAINRVSSLGIKAPKIVGFGVRHLNPAKRLSFLITEAIDEAVSLDQLEISWREQRLSWNIKQQLLKKIAIMVATLHKNGINHRDLYACHFLIKQPFSLEGQLDIILIDWHRAQMRTKTPMRWVIKDLASLYYSILNFQLTKRDIFRFIAYYSEESWSEELKLRNQFWQAVLKRSKQFIKRHHKFFNNPLLHDQGNV